MNISELDTLEREIRKDSSFFVSKREILDLLASSRKFFVLQDKIKELQDKINRQEEEDHNYWYEDEIFGLNKYLE